MQGTSSEYGRRLPWEDQPGRKKGSAPDSPWAGKGTIQRARQKVLQSTLAKLDRHREKYQVQATRNLACWRAAAKSKRNDTPCTVRVLPGDWGEVTRELTEKYGEMFAVLNMANANFPGGGYADGLSAQEENMFRRTDCHYFVKRCELKHGQPYQGLEYKQAKTDLLNAKHGRVALDMNPRLCLRGPEDGEGWEQGRREIGYAWLGARDVFPFLELRAAAVDLSAESDEDGEAYDHVETKRRCAAQLDTLIDAGVKHCVLSAFGCGAFENPADRVAQAYREALLADGGRGPRAAHFAVVAFAVLSKYDPANYGVFKKAFPNNWHGTSKKPAKKVAATGAKLATRKKANTAKKATTTDAKLASRGVAKVARGKGTTSKAPTKSKVTRVKKIVSK
jgi:hypothetical protein